MEFSDRLDSKCNTRSSMVIREHNQNKLRQQKDSLGRMQNVSEKILTKGEGQMKKQLERLELAKKKIERRRSSLVSEDDADEEYVGSLGKSTHSLSSRKSSVLSKDGGSGILSQKKSSTLSKDGGSGILSPRESSVGGSDTKSGVMSNRRASIDSGALAHASRGREVIERSQKTTTDITKAPVTSAKTEQKEDRRKSLATPKQTVPRDKSSEDARRHSVAIGYNPNVRKKSIDKHAVPAIVVTDTGRATPDSSEVSPRSSCEKDRRHISNSSFEALYEMAIKAVSVDEESKTTQGPKLGKKSFSRDDDHSHHTSITGMTFSDVSKMDLSKLKELENLLKEARQYNERRHKEQDYGKRSAAERQQRKRLEYLTEILKDLQGKQKHEFTPKELLNCGYLRLSNSNVETLEDMMKEAGQDPGIHVHSDITKIDVFKNLQAERSDIGLRQSIQHSKTKLPERVRSSQKFN